MDSAFLDALPRHSRGLLIEGYAGIGKTHRWTAAVGAAGQRGWRLLQARPGEADARLGGVGLIDLLAGVTGDELAALPAPQQRALTAALLRGVPDGPPPVPQVVAVALTTLIRQLAQDIPVVIAIDDLQWLDATTGAALGFLARRWPERNVGFIATLRTPAAMASPATELEARGDLTRVVVPPLDEHAISALVRERLPFRVPASMLSRAAATSGGNPFYAVELASMWASATDHFLDTLPVPASLQALVGSRIDALPARTRSALAAASALGRATVPRLRALGLDDALAPAERGGVISVLHGAVRFSHPLLAAACYDALTGTERTALHRRLATLVDDVEPRARHLALGADEPDAGIALQLDQAVALAEARGDVRAAIDAAGLALRTTPDDDPRAPERQLTLARLLFKTGDGEGAQARLETLIDQDPPRRVRVRALTMLCELAFTVVSHEAAQQYGHAAIESADPEADADLLADAHIYFAQALDTLVIAREHAMRALELIESTPSPDPARFAKALALAAGLDFFAGNGLDVGAFERAIALELTGGVPAEESMAGYYMTVLCYSDDIAAARDLCARWEQQCLDEGCESQQPFILMCRSHLALKTGRLDEAEALIRRHLTLAEQSGQEHNARFGRYNLARLALARGDVARARDIGAGLLRAGRDGGGPAIEVIGNRVLGEAGLYDGDLEAAAAHLRRVEELRAGGRDDPSALIHLTQLAEALGALGWIDEAHEVIAHVETQARAVGRASALALVARCHALLAAAGGTEEAAVAALEEALAFYTAPDFYPFDRARTLLVKGQILRRFRRKAQAKQTLILAREAFVALSAPGWVDRVGSELARVGLRPPAPTGLTPTELRVAELVATGMSARDVGATMFLSPRTVEAHLGRVYRKLGIRSRAELGTRLAALPNEAQPS